MSDRVVIGKNDLSLADFVRVARQGAKVELTGETWEAVRASRDVLEKALDSGKAIYGVNTGFGRLADVVVSGDEIAQLQLNLIRADAVGVGSPLPTEAVRGAMLLRINSLSKGFSGITENVLNTLVHMVNAGVHPVIPEKGSVGASGDLCPLAHMVLPMIGEGEAEYMGQVMPGAEAMSRAGLKPVMLSAKEGLALINGTQVMTSVASLALHDAIILAKSADIIATLTCEALNGIADAFDPRIHKCRRHKGQMDAAANIRKVSAGSSYMTRQGEMRVQDAYSIRCVPQIHGASRMALDYVGFVLENEIHAVTDNPLVFEDMIVSGGNFHGQPVAVAADVLGIAAAELANISERRMAKMVDPALNHGLPAFLVSKGGLNCGLMVPQYAAAALVSENKVLAHPASVDSIPTSAGQEDHVSMGTIAARKAAEIVRNAQAVLGIEWMSAAQAVDLRRQTAEAVLGEGSQAAYDLIRQHMRFLDGDRAFYREQRKAAEMIASGELVEKVEAAIGPLA